MSRDEFSYEDWKFQMARKRVKKVKAFYKHFASWMVFSAFFLFLNIATDRHEFWAIFPIMGWGVGLAMHAIGVFGFPGRSKDWEERMMEREMERLDQMQYRRQSASPGQLESGEPLPSQDELELKEMRKQWRDSDLV